MEMVFRSLFSGARYHLELAQRVACPRRIHLSKCIYDYRERPNVRQWRHRRPLRDHMRLLTRDSLEIDFLARWFPHVRACPYVHARYDAITGLTRSGPRSRGCSGRPAGTISAPTQRRRGARRWVSAPRGVTRTALSTTCSVPVSRILRACDVRHLDSSLDFSFCQSCRVNVHQRV